MKKDSVHVAVVGATGAVGVEVIKSLEKRNFPAKKISLFASPRSAGRELKFKGTPVKIEALSAGGFEGVDIAIFSAGSKPSKEFAPHAVKAGAVVVDNTSAFRMDPEIPLVVPEVNGADIAKHKGIIANPNCCAAIMVVALWPLYQRSRIKRIVVSTYQAASGAGAAAMAELESQARDILEARAPKKEVLPHQIAFNVFSHNTKISENGYNEEENKIIQETRKMFHDDQIQISPTCIRVPVFRAHSESILIETEEKITAEEARDILSKAPGVKLVDDRVKNHFPMPIEASQEDDVLIGRIREDLSCPNGLSLFVSGDQLLKGAALNAVQIAEQLLK
jgi:aspartate-semialdehyde dehydrogenase